MSCIHNNAGKCELYNDSWCDIPPGQCRYFKHPLGLHRLTDWSQIDSDKENTDNQLLTQLSNTSEPTNSSAKTEQPQTYCKFCFNARIYEPTEEEMMDPFNTELTDDNDSSSCGVGKGSPDFRLMISSGHGEPVRIETDKWSPYIEQWITVAKYYPKYCPECGRRLNEYEVSKENN